MGGGAQRPRKPLADPRAGPWAGRSPAATADTLLQSCLEGDAGPPGPFPPHPARTFLPSLAPDQTVPLREHRTGGLSQRCQGGDCPGSGQVGWHFHPTTRPRPAAKPQPLPTAQVASRRACCSRVGCSWTPRGLHPRTRRGAGQARSRDVGAHGNLLARQTWAGRTPHF